MTHVFKGLAYLLLTLLAVVALAVLLLVSWVDPNDYREDISRIAYKATGVELTLGGELNWRFYPVLGFGAKGVQLALQSGQPPIVKIGEMTLGVKILPLLSKKIELDELDISGLRATLLVNAQGVNNWQLAEASPPTPASTGKVDSDGDSKTAIPELLVPSIRIRDSLIQYQDQTAAVNYTVELALLELQNVNFKEPFPLLLEARLRDPQKLNVSTRLDTQLSVDLKAGQYGLNALRLTAELGGVFDKAVAVSLEGDLQFDQAGDRAAIKLARMQFANLLARATIEASGVTAEPSYSGQLETEPFNARELLAAMALPVPVTGDTNALTRVQLTAKFDGTAQKVSVKPLTLKLDDSVLSGELAIVDIAKQALRFAVQLDKLDADRYLPPEAEDGAIATASAKPAAEVAAELLPVETLRGLDLKGSFKADQVTVKHIALQDITLSIKAVDGDVRIEDIAAKLLQGTLAGSVIVDASKAQPHITSKLALTDIEMSQLLQPFMNVQLLSGRSSLKLDTSTTGNDMDTLIKQALGHIDLAMADTVLHGVNVNQIALEAIKSKLGDVALLLPDYQQKLPKALKTDTEIRKLLANITVEKGHLIMPAFNADTGQGAFSASGDIDLLNQGFDYRFAVVLAALSDNKYLQGKQWPVRCKGNLATAVTEWCRPDSSAISKVLEQAASQALRDKGAQKLGEKLGLEAADQEAVEAELRNRAKAKEDRAKEKLKQSVNKKLNKLLEKQE